MENGIALLQLEHVFGLDEVIIKPGEGVTIAEGKNGAGKTALVNALMAVFSARGIEGEIITKGSDNGRILVRFNDGRSIRRTFSSKGKTEVHIFDSDGDEKHPEYGPQKYLDELFGSQIINPVQFMQMDTKKQRTVLMSALNITVTDEEIVEWFGRAFEVNTDKHGLEVLKDIETVAYENRKEANSNVKAIENEMAALNKQVPDGFDSKSWEKFDVSTAHDKLQQAGAAKERKAALEAEAQEWRNKANNETIQQESCDQHIAQLQERIIGMEEAKGQAIKRQQEAQIQAANSQNYSLAVEIPDVEEVQKQLSEYTEAQKVMSNLNNIERLTGELGVASKEADELDQAVKIAREKPNELLKKAKFPVEGIGFTDDGITVNGLDIRSLSDGEKLMLGIRIAQSRVGPLGLIVVDGAEKLDPDNLKLLLDTALADEDHFYVVTKVTPGKLHVKQVSADGKEKTLFGERGD